MKIRDAILTILLALAAVAVFLLLTASIAVGQTETQAPAPPVGSAQIPFDFWIGDTHLPAGEYAVYPVLGLNTLVLLRNNKTNAQEHAFLVMTGDPVAAGDNKLVFVTRAGRHYLREVWKAEGKALLTSQVGVSLQPADVRSEVPLTAPSTAKTVATTE